LLQLAISAHRSSGIHLLASIACLKELMSSMHGYLELQTGTKLELETYN
jgi:hypothetical protein